MGERGRATLLVAGLTTSASAAAATAWAVFDWHRDARLFVACVAASACTLACARRVRQEPTARSAIGLWGGAVLGAVVAASEAGASFFAPAMAWWHLLAWLVHGSAALFVVSAAIYLALGRRLEALPTLLTLGLLAAAFAGGPALQSAGFDVKLRFQEGRLRREAAVAQAGDATRVVTWRLYGYGAGHADGLVLDPQDVGGGRCERLRAHWFRCRIA